MLVVIRGWLNWRVLGLGIEKKKVLSVRNCKEWTDLESGKQKVQRFKSWVTLRTVVEVGKSRHQDGRDVGNVGAKLWNDVSIVDFQLFSHLFVVQGASKVLWYTSRDIVKQLGQMGTEFIVRILFGEGERMEKCVLSLKRKPAGSWLRWAWNGEARRNRGKQEAYGNQVEKDGGLRTGDGICQVEGPWSVTGRKEVSAGLHSVTASSVFQLKLYQGETEEVLYIEEASCCIALTHWDLWILQNMYEHITSVLPAGALASVLWLHSEPPWEAGCLCPQWNSAGVCCKSSFPSHSSLPSFSFFFWPCPQLAGS